MSLKKHFPGAATPSPQEIPMGKIRENMTETEKTKKRKAQHADS